MSRYFFDLTNGDGLMRDEEGVELPSRTAIAREVARILGDIARDEMQELKAGTISLNVRDDTGLTISVATLTFRNEWVA